MPNEIRIVGDPLGELFPLGAIGIALEASFELDDETIGKVLRMHSIGQWCDPPNLLSNHDQEANEKVIDHRSRDGLQGEVLSKYLVKSAEDKDIEIYVITNLTGMYAVTIVCLLHER